MNSEEVVSVCCAGGELCLCVRAVNRVVYTGFHLCDVPTALSCYDGLNLKKYV